MDNNQNIYVESLGEELSKEEVSKRLQSIPTGFDNLPTSLHGKKRLIEKVRTQWFLPEQRHLEFYENIYEVIREGYENRPESKFIEMVSITQDWLDNHKVKNFVPRPLSKKPINSFCVLGSPGMGKTTGIERVLTTCFNQVVKQPNKIQVTYLIQNCTTMKSLKALAINFFSEMDAVLGNYWTSQGMQYKRTLLDEFTKSKYTAEKLLPYMANTAAQQHLGVLVIDEINNLNSNCSNLEFQTIMNFLKNLSSAIGLPIVIAGTQEVTSKLTYNMQFARRIQGIGFPEWTRYDRNDHLHPEKKKYWSRFIRQLFRFQILHPAVELTDEIETKYFELSEGQIDKCVHLHIRLQKEAAKYLHAKGILENTPNIVSTQFIDQVDRNYFSVTRPMIKAIKSKDPSLIQHYKDLTEGLPTLVNAVAREMSLNQIAAEINDSNLSREDCEFLLTLLKSMHPEVGANNGKSGKDSIEEKTKKTLSKKSKKNEGEPTQEERLAVLETTGVSTDLPEDLHK